MSRRTRLRLRGPQLEKGFGRCPSRKFGYRTHEEALEAAESMMEQGRVNPGCHITPYLCADCGEHHLGNKIIVPVGFRPDKSRRV